MPVERRLVAPKTWEYYNYGDEPQAAPTVDESATNATPSQAMFDEMQQSGRSAAPASPSQEAQRRAWRSQLRNFDRTLKKDPSVDNQIQGVQELLDSGAVWMDDNGDVFGALERHPSGDKGTQRMLDAMRTWGDWYRDQGEQPPPQKHYQDMMLKQQMEMDSSQMDWEKIKQAMRGLQ